MLRVSHNNAGSHPEWHLEKVQTYSILLPQPMISICSTLLLNINPIYIIALAAIHPDGRETS